MAPEEMKQFADALDILVNKYRESSFMVETSFEERVFADMELTDKHQNIKMENLRDINEALEEIMIGTIKESQTVHETEEKEEDEALQELMVDQVQRVYKMEKDGDEAIKEIVCGAIQDEIRRLHKMEEREEDQAQKVHEMVQYQQCRAVILDRKIQKDEDAKMEVDEKNNIIKPTEEDVAMRVHHYVNDIIAKAVLEVENEKQQAQEERKNKCSDQDTINKEEYLESKELSSGVAGFSFEAEAEKVTVKTEKCKKPRRFERILGCNPCTNNKQIKDKHTGFFGRFNGRKRPKNSKQIKEKYTGGVKRRRGTIPGAAQVQNEEQQEQEKLDRCRQHVAALVQCGIDLKNESDKSKKHIRQIVEPRNNKWIKENEMSHSPHVAASIQRSIELKNERDKSEKHTRQIIGCKSKKLAKENEMSHSSHVATSIQRGIKLNNERDKSENDTRWFEQILGCNPPKNNYKQIGAFKLLIGHERPKNNKQIKQKDTCGCRRCNGTIPGAAQVQNEEQQEQEKLDQCRQHIAALVQCGTDLKNESNKSKKHTRQIIRCKSKKQIKENEMSHSPHVASSIQRGIELKNEKDKSKKHTRQIVGPRNNKWIKENEMSHSPHVAASIQRSIELKNERDKSEKHTRQIIRCKSKKLTKENEMSHSSHVATSIQRGIELKNERDKSENDTRWFEQSLGCNPPKNNYKQIGAFKLLIGHERPKNNKQIKQKDTCGCRRCNGTIPGAAQVQNEEQQEQEKLDQCRQHIAALVQCGTDLKNESNKSKKHTRQIIRCKSKKQIKENEMSHSPHVASSIQRGIELKNEKDKSKKHTRQIVGPRNNKWIKENEMSHSPHVAASIQRSIELKNERDKSEKHTRQIIRCKSKKLTKENEMSHSSHVATSIQRGIELKNERDKSKNDTRWFEQSLGYNPPKNNYKQIGAFKRLISRERPKNNKQIKQKDTCGCRRCKGTIPGAAQVQNEEQQEQEKLDQCRQHIAALVQCGIDLKNESDKSKKHTGQIIGGKSKKQIKENEMSHSPHVATSIQRGIELKNERDKSKKPT